MKSIITFAFILFHCFAFGQLKLLTVQDVDKIIRLTISQKMTDKNLSCEYGQCGEWWTANSDSIFYKSDTVKFYNSSNIFYSDTTFCTSLVWDFDKGNAFHYSQANMCQEPPTRTIEAGAFLSGQKNTLKIPNRYKVKYKDRRPCIIIYVNHTVFETFTVIALTKAKQSNLGDKSYVLTLVRQK